MWVAPVPSTRNVRAAANATRSPDQRRIKANNRSAQATCAATATTSYGMGARRPKPGNRTFHKRNGMVDQCSLWGNTLEVDCRGREGATKSRSSYREFLVL